MKLPIYDTNKSNTHRYSLGDLKDPTVFVFGVNPSTASDTRLDPTLKNVNSFAQILGFESFLMLNLYPQRATNPDDLHLKLNKKAHEMNLEFIAKYIPEKATVWAAWGNLITHRPYLIKCLEDINEVLKNKNIKWIKYDEFTKAGHPKHPSRKKLVDLFNEFDIDRYMKLHKR